MTNVGSFDIKGNKVGFSLHFDVYRVNDIIVLEFFNNSILPIVLKERKDGYHCYVLWREIFKAPVFEDEIFHVVLESAVYASGTDVILCVGDKENPRLKASIQAGTFGNIKFLPDTGRYCTADEVREWCGNNGVVLPIGVASAASQLVMCRGFSFTIASKYYLFGFPNGMKFPVFRERYGLRVVEQDLCFDNSVRLLSLRVYQMTPDFVRFRLLFFLGDTGYHIMSCQDIKYGRDFVEYAGQRIKTAQITKELFLRG